MAKRHHTYPVFSIAYPSVTSRMLCNPNLNLLPPRMKTQFGQNSSASRKATIGNPLPNDCRMAKILSQRLKSEAKDHAYIVPFIWFLYFSLSFVPFISIFRIY